MAVQLSHPQAVYECGFCSFTSPDHKVLVKHLVDHPVLKEKKHEHILWCGLCKPSLTDANHIEDHQQAMSNDHLNGSVYHDNYNLGYGDASNYYSGYNGLYNPYFFPNTYYYPIAYRNPCYGNINGYYQTHNTILYADDYYNGTDVFPTLDTPGFIEPVPENKYILDTPHNSENILDADSSSTRSLNMALSDFEVHANDSNCVNYDSNIKILPVDPKFTGENSPTKYRYKESSIGAVGTFSKSMAIEEINVVQPNEFKISNIEPQPEVNKSSIQPASDSTFSKTLNGSHVKKPSSKGIPDPKLNTDKRNPFKTNVREATVGKNVPKDLTESSNFEFLSEACSKGVGSRVVDGNSIIKTNSINMNANTEEICAPNKSCYSKLPSIKIAEPSENDVIVNSNSTEEHIPVSFPETADVEKIVINASDVKNCSIDVKVDTRSKNTLKKESNSQQHKSEREASSENFIGKCSIPAQDQNVVPISDAKSSPKVYTTVLTEDTLDVETDSIDVSGPRTKIDQNEIHSENPTGGLETLPKIKNSISVLSKNDSLVSASKLSPKINVMIVRENSLSDIKIKSIGMNGDPRTKKDKMLGSGKQRVLKFERGPRRMQLKIETCEADLNQNSHRGSKDNSTEAITESSKKCQSDKTGDLSNVGNSLRNICRSDLNYTNKTGGLSNVGNSHQNMCRSDLNYTNKNYGSVPAKGHLRLTYSEVLKRGLPLKG